MMRSDPGDMKGLLPDRPSVPGGRTVKRYTSANEGCFTPSTPSLLYPRRGKEHLVRINYIALDMQLRRR